MAELAYTYYDMNAEDEAQGVLTIIGGDWVVADEVEGGETFRVVKDLAVEGYKVVQEGDAADGPWI